MRARPHTWIGPALASLLMLCLGSGAAEAAGLDFTPCPHEGAYDCAALSVPLSRSGIVPGTLTLQLERRQAAAGPARSAVVALAGGPGQAALPLTGFIDAAMAPALPDRDLIVFDQRGTGTSDPLTCSAFEQTLGPNSVERCAAEIGPGRGSYTTSESVEDIEAIRVAGGYEKLVLYGTSYGTKVALDYAARYPQHVEALVLDSTETPEGPEPFHLNTYKAVGPMLAELCAARACRASSSDPLTSLARLIAKAEHQPLRALSYGGSGKPRHGQIYAADIYSLLLGGDLDPALRAGLPAAVHSALAGDNTPLMALLELGSVHVGSGEEVDQALFLATSCEETLFPWNRQAPAPTRVVEAERALDALPATDFYPFGAEAGLLFENIPACSGWPDASPAPAAVGPEPDVPTLILSGGQDLRTPTANAQAVAAMIPDAQILRVPYTGHSVIGSDLTDCAKLALEAFFAGRQVAACAHAPDRFPPVAPAPERLADVSAAHASGGGTPGRTATAVIDTVGHADFLAIGIEFQDGTLPSGLRIGGLRGGYLSVSSGRVILHSFSYVPGVTVSGTIPASFLLKGKGGRVDLAVGGPSAAHGSVMVSAAGALTGTLGGRRLKLAARAHSAADDAVSWIWPAGAAAAHRFASRLG